MANPLTHVQKAKIHEDEASVFDALAKAARLAGNAAKAALDSNSTKADRLNVIAIYNEALHFCQMSESHTVQQAEEIAQPDPP